MRAARQHQATSKTDRETVKPTGMIMRTVKAYLTTATRLALGLAMLGFAQQASALTAQTITGFAPATPITYSTGETFSLTAKGGASGNAVTFASTTTSICTVSASKVTVLALSLIHI